MKTKLTALLLSLSLLLTLCVGCTQDKPENPADNSPQVSQPSENDPDTKPSGEGSATVTFTDMMGRKITLDKPAERIVVLAASDCEILYAIGAGDTVVGRGEYCDYPAQVLGIPAIGSGGETNIEQIIALQPDVLLMNDMDQTEEQVEQLEKAGIKVVMSNDSDIAEVYTAIEMIGTLTGKAENAAAVINSMKTTFAEIQAKSTGDGTQTVYFEVSPLQWGLWTAGANTFMDEIAAMLGLKNCFADVDGWGEISEEQVLERNPDFIVTITMYFGEGPTPEEEILSRAGWQDVAAVKNGKILNLQNNELSRPGPRLADGAQMMFDFVYGE